MKEQREIIAQNIRIVRKRIQDACHASGREESAVKLLLATKTVPADLILHALEEGETMIGENKVQEIKEKYEKLTAVPHEKHFIGHLQTNKIKEVLKYGVTCIQSLDRLDVAEKLHKRLVYEGKNMDVLIQVNTSFEDSKFGVHPDDAVELVCRVAQLDTLNIKGLMTIGLFSAEQEKVRNCFRLLKAIQQQIILLNIPGVSMDELSMGMSGDLETAIQEGATIVRVGTAVFGERAYPDSYYWNENTSV